LTNFRYDVHFMRCSGQSFKGNSCLWQLVRPNPQYHQCSHTEIYRQPNAPSQQLERYLSKRQARMSAVVCGASAGVLVPLLTVRSTLLFISAQLSCLFNLHNTQIFTKQTNVYILEHNYCILSSG